MSVISRSSRYRLCSSEGSPSSSKLISDIHTPPAPTTYNMWRSEFRAGTGGHRSLPSCGTTVQHYGVRRRRFLFGEPISFSPVGDPPKVCDTIFPDWCLPEKDKNIVTQSMGHRQVIPSYTTHKLRSKLPRRARGWESKSVEQQQEEMSERRKTVGAPISPDEQQRNRKREGLLLSRKRLTQQLQAAYNPRHRQMLGQAIAELDRQLSSF